MSDHATLAPSASNRWLNCPGSIAMSVGCEDREGPAAREGTFAHHIAERALTEDRRAVDYLGETDGEFTVDQEMADHVQIYLDVVSDLMLLADEAHFEVKVRWSDDNYGTVDAVIRVDDTLHIVDLKFGRQAVDVEMNTQLLNYACATIVSMELQGRVNTVKLHIVQPRDFGNPPHKQSTMTAAAVDNWAHGVLDPGIAATKDPRARLQPGDHCGFCPAKAKCHAFNDRAVEAAQDVFPDGDVERPVAPPRPASLTPERLKAVLDAAPLVRQWLAMVEEFGHLEAKAGRTPEGYKLVATLGNRKWKDEAAAQRELRAQGIDPIVEKTISPNQAQQKLGNRKAHKEFVNELCDRPVTGDKLVPESDKRPALPGGDVFPMDPTNKE